MERAQALEPCLDFDPVIHLPQEPCEKTLEFWQDDTYIFGLNENPVS